MAPHPSSDDSGDGRLVNGLRARQRGVAAKIYDVYGNRLFAYATVLLGDEGLSGRAVRAALLAARASPDSVPEPERFRAWLYALVRDECLSRLGDRPPQPAEPAEAAEPASVAMDEDVHLEPGRLIFHYAMNSPGDLALESADLTLRHGLGTRELAEVLGISAQQATDLKARLNATLKADLNRTSKAAAPPPAPVRTLPAPALAPAPQTRPPDASPVEPRPRAPRTSGGVDDRRRHKRLSSRVKLGASAGTLVTSGVAMIVGFAVLSQSPEGAPKDRGPQSSAPASDAALGPPPTDESPPSSGAPSQPTPAGTSPAPADPVTPENSPPPQQPGGRDKPPAKKPPKGGAQPPPAGSGAGRLAVSDGGCRGVAAPVSRSCGITLTAVGGSVRWAVASVDAGIAEVDASGGGTLSSGQSTTVTVTIRPTVRCYAGGFGSGSIGFAPGGTAGISYTCW